MPIQEIRSRHLRWTDITNARDLNSPEIKFLKRNYSFHPVNLRESIAIGQRPKVDIYRDYIFLVLLYPVYSRKTGEITAAEIDFFIGKDYIISVHDRKLPAIVHFYNHLLKSKNRQEKEEFLSNNVFIVLYELINKLIWHCFPMLDHISMDIRKAEKGIFQGKEKIMVEKILSSRRNIVSFRKSMQAHKNILKKIKHANREIKFFDPAKAEIYFNSLIDKVKEIWDLLDSFKESIEALQDTNESLISFRLNQIMKTFTIISITIFALTLVGTLLGVGAKGTPIINWPLAFWAILMLEALVATFIFLFFKRKKWIG